MDLQHGTAETGGGNKRQSKRGGIGLGQQKPKLGSTKLGEARLNGNIIISELIRNMELGRFEMTYTVLLPCVFTVYLNPQDHATLRGVFDLVIDDAKKALRARVTELNSDSSVLGIKRRVKSAKEFKIAGRDWSIEFLPEPEVPHGDVEIHSELNETAEPGYRGMKTTLMGREPVVSGHRTTGPRSDANYGAEPVFAEIRYEDDSGPQVYLLTQNSVRIGRGGGDHAMDLALYTNDEVSREHLMIQRDPGTGMFSVTDLSTNGTWVDGKRLRKGAAEVLQGQATIVAGEVITLNFEARK
jgi:hypothetical protein